MRTRRGGVILAGLLAALCLGTRSGEAQSWSPGGRWLAYTLAERPACSWPGWLFGSDEPEENQKAVPLVYRVWTTEIQAGTSVLLSESLEPITRPGWRRDGTALAFSRVAVGKDGRKRLELVVQDAPDRARVIQTWPFGGMADAASLLNADVTWSPEGRFLVAPRLEPEGLAVVRVENGKVAFDLNGASRASWSLDGARLAYFRDADPPVLEVLDVRSGDKTVLTEAPDSDLFPAPVWSPDGESVMFVAWNQDEAKPGRRKPEGDGSSLNLDRRDVAKGKRELAIDLSHPPITSKKDLRFVRLSFDVEGSQLFYSIALEGKEVGIRWVYLRRQESRKLFNPYQNSRPVFDLAVCPLPNSTQLALRFGSIDRPTPPALCDAETEDLTPLVPDDEARAAWILSILSAMSQSLASSEEMFGGNEPMPTRLPMPGDTDPSHPAFFRLRELARQGRPLCDRPADAAPASPELLELLEEARLVFSYLLGEYPQALAAVESREEQTASRDERLRLMGVRAQIYVGMGQIDRALAIVDHLRKQSSMGSTRLEETGAGYTLVTLPDAAESWPEMLAVRLDALKHGTAGEPEVEILDDPILDHVNPDAPRPGLGLDPVPIVDPPAPLPPGAMLPAAPPDVRIQIVPEDPGPNRFRRVQPPAPAVRVRIVPDRAR